MAIKSILIACGTSDTSKGALDLAIQMSMKYGAHLTGVVVHGENAMASRYGAWMTKQIMEMLTERDSEVVAEIRARFSARVAEIGAPERSEFLDISGSADFRLSSFARCYDIVVMGPRAAEAGREHFAPHPDMIALQSGRPIIVAPADYTAEKLGEHALLAWDGQRAAARALGDAMLILETKAKVTVLSVGDAVPEVPPGGGILELLRRHNIAAEHLHRPRAKGGVAGAILSTAQEIGAGLVVMGAFEHSKFTQDIVGGVTTQVFASARVPVLLAH
ncbi:MAG: universal stress protein [Alphaproteobacteria bacterium HGW-Alphaproteobacteria-8]|nr:MAG: universal stress protein [Alphaproteobacteria bacterium HGW-Alphaproteobacteria-8]